MHFTNLAIIKALIRVNDRYLGLWEFLFLDILLAVVDTRQLVTAVIVCIQESIHCWKHSWILFIYSTHMRIIQCKLPQLYLVIETLLSNRAIMKAAGLGMMRCGFYREFICIICNLLYGAVLRILHHWLQRDRLRFKPYSQWWATMRYILKCFFFFMFFILGIGFTCWNLSKHSLIW